jgi:glutamate racemase
VSRPAPIGVFDSGVGGISVLREVRRLLPGEDLVYVADSGHCPYGGKSYAEIQVRACAITRFLVGQGSKVVVVACNTATAAAIETLRATFGDVPIVGMEPAIKPAVAATRSGVVGVLATGATLGGERFAGLAQRFSDGVELLTQACPGLVERVEAGDLDGPQTLGLLRLCVQPLLARGADTLVLGCTHYPFLRNALFELVGPEVVLIDTGEAVARQVARVVDAEVRDRPGDVRFVTGDMRVAPVMRRLWGEAVQVEILPA